MISASTVFTDLKVALEKGCTENNLQFSDLFLVEQEKLEIHFLSFMEQFAKPERIKKSGYGGPKHDMILYRWNWATVQGFVAKFCVTPEGKILLVGGSYFNEKSSSMYLNSFRSFDGLELLSEFAKIAERQKDEDLLKYISVLGEKKTINYFIQMVPVEGIFTFLMEFALQVATSLDTTPFVDALLQDTPWAQKPKNQ